MADEFRLDLKVKSFIEDEKLSREMLKVNSEIGKVSQKMFMTKFGEFY